MAKRQWGWTADTQAGYPPYINVTEQDDGQFMITIRSNPTFDGHEGNQASILMSADTYLLYLKDLQSGE